MLGQLLDWIRQHATQFDKSAAAVTEAEIAEKHPDYWNTVRELLTAQVGKSLLTTSR